MPQRLTKAAAVCLFAFLLFHVSNVIASRSCVQEHFESRLTTATAQATPSSTSTFDGARAFAHVRKMVELGPRPAGSKELARTREYIIGELKSDKLKITTDEFVAATPVGKRKMVNVIAELPGASSDFIIISSHYDTKPFKEFRFVGANDGGSSTGVLLELARVLANTPQQNRLSYRFVFFDGEEAFCREWDECGKPGAPDNTYGSRHYLAHLKGKNELKNLRALILLDMIGYQRLELGRDTTSTPWLLDAVWQTARETGHGDVFVARAEGVGGDDHEAYLQVGVPALDLIQLSNYPYWHKATDTLDKISAQSLQTVGEVVQASLPRIEESLSKAGERK